MITRKSFRVKVRATGGWVIGIGEFEELTSKNKSEAIIWKPDERRNWEDYDEFEIVEVTESEVMESLGREIAPRLPGF